MVIANAYMSHGYGTAIIGLLVLSLVYYVYRSYQWKKKYRLPPQVPGLPVFGNSFQVPAIQQGPWAKKLAEKYGEMYVNALSL